MRNKRYIWIFLGLLCNLIIFGHSMMNASTSSTESNFIVDFLSKVLGVINIHIDKGTLSFLVRKTAHFSIFAISATIWFQMYKTLKMKPFTYFSIIHGLITAITDETIQGFSVGRSKELRDVIIDVYGVFVGCLAILFIDYRRGEDIY